MPLLMIFNIGVTMGMWEFGCFWRILFSHAWNHYQAFQNPLPNLIDNQNHAFHQPISFSYGFGMASFTLIFKRINGMAACCSLYSCSGFPLFSFCAFLSGNWQHKKFMENPYSSFGKCHAFGRKQFFYDWIDDSRLEKEDWHIGSKAKQRKAWGREKKKKR